MPRSADYDLRTRPRRRRGPAPTREPEIVIHLAAVVGGIGANRENPGRFFHDNPVMGIELIEAAAAGRRREVRPDRHGLLLPQVHAGAVPRGRPLERLPGGDQRPLRPRQEDARSSRRQAYREQYGHRRRSTSSRSTSTARATTSTRASSHVIPALIKKCVDADEARRRPHRRLGHRHARRREFLYVDDAAEGIVLAAERYDGAEPVNLGAGQRDHDPRARRR